MTCYCGAHDCPSCGPAQGYEVVRVWDARARRWTYRNPPEDEDEIIEDEREEDERW